MTRFRFVVPVVVAVLAAGCGGGDDSSSDESTAPAPAAETKQERTAPVAAAAAFRVVYKFEDTAGAETRVQTHVLSVQRPYQARLEKLVGLPPGAEAINIPVVNRDYRYVLEGGKVLSAVPRAPEAPVEIVSAEAFQAAASHGVVKRLGEATVAGETCVRYAYRQGGTKPLAAPTKDEQVESCVTPDGLLLRETATIAGRQVRSTEAVEVSRTPSFTAETFLVEYTPDPKTVAISGYNEGVQVVSEGKAPDGTEVVALTAPPGFQAGRKVALNREVGPGISRLVYLEAFERGSDLVVIEQVLSDDADAPWPATEGKAAEVAKGVTARAVHRSNYLELRVTTADGFFRVQAPTLPLALEVARLL